MLLLTRLVEKFPMASRRLRGFKRWMKSQLIDCSDALYLVVTDDVEVKCPLFSVSVKALCDLHEGDVVATIPKDSCLTNKTSSACHLIADAGLDGFLALAVAIMYEISLGPASRWFGYLQIMPHNEPIPLLWSVEEIDSLLAGTELHKVVKEDKLLVYEDWKECIQPLLDSSSLELDPEFFGVEQYLAAKSLISSRSFEIDDYHGSGMVPLADLFNHKTDGEHVHFTLPSAQSGSDSDDPDAENDNNEDEKVEVSELVNPKENSDTTSSSDNDTEVSSSPGNESSVLEMIIVKDVKLGDEVFNTYGSLGNAALLHRYGFTEPDNPYDIVNIDLELVLNWCSSMFTNRHSRTRLSLWRKLNYSGCVSQNLEYFEVSFHGEPELELLILLYIMLLPEEEYNKLDLMEFTADDFHKFISVNTMGSRKLGSGSESELRISLLNAGVREALVNVANIRESFYGSRSLQKDLEVLKKCSSVLERKLYHSLVLRVSERNILGKLRGYALTGTRSLTATKGASSRKRRRVKHQ
ncbi:hypothetical protein Leryth_001739 [Lithospermum erythrorhizon]|nr:hypothetical protein Leryth_001739 [Lithospermum erythrorhizon]